MPNYELSNQFSKKQLAKQDKHLQDSFDYYNGRFFNDKISLSTVVRFAKTYDEKEKNPGDAHYLSNKQIIEIDELYRGRTRQVEILLIHEMAHAYLYQNGYLGHPSEGGHGDAFKGEIWRLIRAGAYDGLL